MRLMILSILAACTPDGGRFRVELDLPAEAQGWVWIAVVDGGGAPLREVGPVQVSANLSVDLLEVPHQSGLRVVGAHRQTRWDNAPVTHRAETPAFDFNAGDTITVAATFVVVDEGASEAPPGPDLGRVIHVRRPWGSSADGGRVVDFALGEPGAVSPGATVVVFDRSEVTGAERGRAVANDDGSFRVDVGEGLEAPARIFVAVSPDGRRLSDTSTQAGLQAGLVVRARWTAGFRSRRPGDDFPNPNRLTVRRRVSSALTELGATDTEPSAEALEGFYPQAGHAPQPVVAEHLLQWRERRFDANPRFGTGTVGIFDPVRGVTVVLAGSLGLVDAGQNETWIWDGQQWSQAQTALRPPTDNAHTMVFHAGLRKAVLFGGGRTDRVGASDELWAFDGQAWARVEVEGPRPPPRTGAALTYDASRGRLVLFGGCPDPRVASEGNCREPNLGDLWELVDNRWVERPFVSGPGPINDGSFVYDPLRKRSYLVSNGNDQVWSWNGVRWRQEPSLPVPASLAPGLVWDPYAERILMFDGLQFGDGVTESARNLFFAFDGTSWSETRLDPDSPFPGLRVDGLLVHDAVRQEFLLISGSAIDQDSRLWRFSNDRWRASLSPVSRLPARRSPVAAYDSARRRWILFGGIAGSTVLDDLWEFDGETWYQIPRSEPWPPARYFAQAAYDGGGGEFVMSGGASSLTDVLDDGTWLWNGQRWRQIASNVDDRISGAMAYDAARGQIVLFSGAFAQTTPPLATSIYEDGVGWTSIPFVNPSPSRGTGIAAAYDPVRRRVVIAGGYNNGRTSDEVWSWDGARWESEPFLPEPRAFGQLVYDRTRDRLIYHGGATGLEFEDIKGSVFELAPGATEWTFATTDGTLASPVVSTHVGTYFPPLER